MLPEASLAGNGLAPGPRDASCFVHSAHGGLLALCQYALDPARAPAVAAALVKALAPGSVAGVRSGQHHTLVLTREGES